MKIDIKTKPIQEEYVILEAGKRSFCHPSLKVLEYYDCKIVYNIPNKFFIVDYNRDGNLKTLLSSRVDFIIDILLGKNG